MQRFVLVVYFQKPLRCGSGVVAGRGLMDWCYMYKLAHSLFYSLLAYTQLPLFSYCFGG
jgi:hypothetical protein